METLKKLEEDEKLPNEIDKNQTPQNWCKFEISMRNWDYFYKTKMKGRVPASGREWQTPVKTLHSLVLRTWQRKNKNLEILLDLLWY